MLVMLEMMTCSTLDESLSSAKILSCAYDKKIIE